MAEQTIGTPNNLLQQSGSRSSPYGADAASAGGASALGGTSTTAAGTGAQSWSGDGGGGAPMAPQTRLGQVEPTNQPSPGKPAMPAGGDPLRAFMQLFGL
jgi:hypothetical protein